jgi:hypothetical protein
MTTQTYATQPTAYYLAAQAAFAAGGPALDIAGGTLVVGDGNGAVPAISALIAANGVTHEVWRGQTIQSVSMDANNAAQLDIQCEVPAAIGGAEIGPFTVTEFAILDVLGNCCIVGTTSSLQKTVSSQGQTSDLTWIAAVACAVGAVTLTPPTGGFASMAQVEAAFNANLPSCAVPLTKTDTPNAGGWIERVFGIEPASQPADPVTATTSAAAMGSGRPASAAEWAAGAPTAGGFAWPWPTLQQVAGALAAIVNSITALGASLAGYLLKSGGTMTGPLVLAADPTASPQAATKHYVDSAIGGISIPSVAGYLPLAGGDMTGPLITARDPQTAMEAANKEYVDNSVAAANPFMETGVGAALMISGQALDATGPAVGTTAACTYSGGSAKWGGAAFSDARWPSSAPPGEWTAQTVIITGNFVTGAVLAGGSGGGTVEDTYATSWLAVLVRTS